MAAVANVQLTVDAKNAIQQLDRVKAATDGVNKTFTDSRGRLRNASGQFTAMSKTAGTARKSVQALGIAFTTYLAPVVALSAAITGLSKSLSVMSDREADAAALANGLKGLTTDGEAALNSLKESADRLGKATLFNEEDFTQGFKLLTSFRTIGVSSYEEVASTAADMAQVLDQDVNSVLMQVAKALEAPEVGLTALQRSGTRFTDQQKQQVKAMVAAGKTAEAQGFILKELQRQYGGASEAAAKGFAGAMDTLGEVTRDALEEIGKLIAPAITQGIQRILSVTEKVGMFMSALGKVVLPQLKKAAEPIISTLQGLWDQVPWDQVGNILQNILIVGFQTLAQVLQVVTPIIAKIIEALVNGLKNSPLGFIVQQAHSLAVAMGLAQPIVSTLANDVGQVNTNFRDMPQAIDAAAEAQKRQVESLKQAVEYTNQQKDAIKAQEAALNSSISINQARLNAEKEINNLQGQILNRAYEQATTAQQRLQIAKQIFQNTVRGAQIEYQQALASIQAEEQRLQLKLKGAEAEYNTIAARGQLAILEAKSVEEETKKRAQLEAALASQQAAAQVIADQISAQQQIGQYQQQAAEAQLKSKVLAAQTALEQKLISDKIGLSQVEATRLSGQLAQGATSTNQLASGTGQVANNAQQSAVMFIQVANNAASAAAAINNAAAAQERLNAARARSGGGGGGGGGGGAQQAAKGAYWQGGFQAFAKGGMVTGPTLGLIGEGGESEYIIPQSKAAGFAMNYLGGKRGAGAIPGFAEGGYVASSANVNIQTGPVTQMNGTNYVTTQEMGKAVQAGVQQTLDVIRRDNYVRMQLGLS